MATIIGLPKLSPTMEEGVLAKWHRKEGDKVSPGDIIAEVETDKANMDFPLEDEGTLLKLLVKEGETVKLGAPVAILGEPGEDVTALEAQARAQMAAPAVAAAPAPAAAPAKPAAAPPPMPPPAGPPAGNGAGRILASPIAKTLAAENGIDLRGVQGSGPGGRIVEKDVQALLKAPAPAPTPARAPTPVLVPAGDEYTDKSLSMMRKTIAKRLMEAKAPIPHFYLTATCDAAPLMAFRAALNAVTADEQKISVNDVIVKAAAVALTRVPAANASFLGDRIRYHGRVHVGVAVAIDDGLITPVVRDTDRKGLAAISAEIRELAGRARLKKLAPEEMTGGTFTVSNLGMFGIDHFEAILNPPEACILAVGAVRKQPVVVDDKLEIGQRMGLTLSCDHRAVDGALGAKLLAEIVKILEHPAALAL